MLEKTVHTDSGPITVTATLPYGDPTNGSAQIFAQVKGGGDRIITFTILSGIIQEGKFQLDSDSEKKVANRSEDLGRSPEDIVKAVEEVIEQLVT